MERTELIELTGQLFSGEYKEQSTGVIKKFGGVLKKLDDNMATFEGRYKTFILDYRTLGNINYRQPDEVRE